MTKSVVISFNESDENLLMAFFKRLNIKIHALDAQKEARIHARINDAVQNGYWNTLNKSQREEFVFGCMLEEVDTSKTVDTNLFIEKLQSRLKKIRE
jgi:hypothetical protein